jgi:hypothetical protein
MDKLKIYINGVYNNSANYSKTISLGSQSLAIGGIPHMENSYPNNGLNGKVSDVTVYGRALGAGEISQSFNSLRSRYGL